MKRLMPGLVLLALALSAAFMLPVEAAQNPFRIFPEFDGHYSSDIRIMPTYVDARVLAANTNESHTVPTGARFVIFSSNCAAFYAKSGATAAIPAADVTDGTGSSLNPSAWFIDGTTAIALISPTTCIVTMEFFK